jgi:DnaJ-class molecular chaperone
LRADQREELQSIIDSDELNEQEEEKLCGACNGSGEGMYDGTVCSTCKGKGVEP